MIWLKTIPPSWPYLVETWTKVDQFPINQPFRRRINTHVSINIIRGMIKTGLDLSHGIFFLVPATVLSGMRNAAVLQKFVSRSFCIFAHNWHFIFCSSTTTTFVQIFRLQTDNWVFISKLYQELFTVWLSHPIISLYSLTAVPQCCSTQQSWYF